MKVNETYSIEKDPHNYIVVEKTLNSGVVKNGKKIPPANKYSESKSYYPTLLLACLALIRKQIEVETMESIKNSIEVATDEITKAVAARETA